MKNPRPCREGFTLVEAILSITIASCLAGLLVPAFSQVLERSRSLACASNLRQIGVCALLYAADHDQKFPVIEPWPSRPVYVADVGADTILEVFQPYGLTERSLQCRCDLGGPNYFSQEGSSYQWFPGANGQNLLHITLGWGFLPDGVKLSQLITAFDYTNIHGKKSNILFGDGHVGGAGTGN